MLPKTDTRDGGLHDRLRVVYYHIREDRYFSHSVAVLWAVQASENLVLRHKREMSGDKVGGGHKRTGKRERPGLGISLGTGMEKWEGTSRKGKVV